MSWSATPCSVPSSIRPNGGVRWRRSNRYGLNPCQSSPWIQVTMAGMSKSADVYARATLKTFDDLKTIAASPKISALSRLSLPEIESITEQIAQVVPAGNVPGLILGGLARLEGRHVPPIERQRHLDMLFRGVRDALDRAVYGAVFAGPAAILMGYQKLLQLAGKDVEAAFPEGTWQFYLQFALREDSARHTNETTGFQHSLAAHRIALRETDALTAWIMAALLTVRQYDRLLENEWRERTATTVLQEVAMAYVNDPGLLTRLQNSYRLWEDQRPYVRGHDAGDADYPAYRRRQFDLFFQPYLASLPAEGQEAFAAALSEAECDSLPAYQRQMTILAQLCPDVYRDERIPYSLEQSSVAVVYKANYVLIPVSSAPEGAMPDVESVRTLAACVLSHPHNGPSVSTDLLLAEASRSAQAGAPKAGLRALPDAQAAVSALAHAPIILNWDQCDARLPLTAIRQGNRGVGDHALTLFFTPESTVFDQSHIFFDGTWGAALAEIMTGEALSWALYLAQLPASNPRQESLSFLPMAASDRLREAAAQARLSAEAGAESTAIRLAPVMALRRLFKTRNDLLNLTV